MNSIPGADLKKHCILIADDDHSIRKMVVEILNGEGYQIIEAESADRTMELALAHRIDSFLIRMDMPGRNGMDICAELRETEPHKFTPVVLFTRPGVYAPTVAAFESGCNDVIVGDPLHADVLRMRLKEHIERTEYFEHIERTHLKMIKYLSRRTMEVISAAPQTDALPPPEERNIAVLFTDLRGFTSKSEEIEPVRLFELVSTLLGHQVKLIHEFGGYVDKFGGDGVMAVFDGPDMVVQSCLCALRIVETSPQVIPEESREFWESGIGIHMGRAVIGNIGSQEHLDYSAIGTTVNLAARLCGQAEATSIVVSKAVRDAVCGDSRLRFDSEKKVKIRGIRDLVTVYTLSETIPQK